MRDEQPKWLEKAKETYRFHRSKLLSNDKWILSQTARALRRSLGSVSEDLMIVRWNRDYEEQLKKFDYAYEALAFIKKKQKEQNMEKID